MLRNLALGLCLTSLAFFAGCAEPLEELGELSCTRNGKCPLGYGCRAGKCLPTSELVKCTGATEGDVKVTALQRYVTEAGVTERPAEWTVGAFSLEAGEPSNYTSASGGTGAPSLTIASLSEQYMLRYHRMFVVTSCRNLDMTEYFLGRQERTFGESNTTLTLSVQNLRNWQEDDVLQMVSTSAALYLDNAALWSPSPPAQGSSHSELQIPFAGLPLLEREPVYVSQLVNVPTGFGFDMQLMDRLAVVIPEVSMSNGAPSYLSVPLETLPPMNDSPQASRLRLTYDPAEFEKQSAPLKAGSRSSGHYFYVSAAASMDTLNHAKPDLARGAIPAGTPAFDIPVPLVQAYSGRPKNLHIGVGHYHQRGPTGGDTFTFRSGLSNEVLLNPDGSVPPEAFQVNVGPIRDPQIEEEPLDTEQEGVGLTPVLNWGAPLVGDVTRYVVVLYRVYEQGITSTWERVATFQTRENSLVLPELPTGPLLEEDEEYFVVIEAVVAPNAQFDVEPFDSTLPLYRSTFVSAKFTP